MNIDHKITIRALRTKQGDVTVFLFFMPGTHLLEVADIARLERGDESDLKGFQRKEIRQHVNAIANYLDNGGRLFPNAIILALAPEIKFKQSRGPVDAELDFADIDAGKITIPIKPKGKRVAWIVDGQQRSLALLKSKHGNLSVPVVAFECDSIDMQREQFILVNRAKPLPQRLIDELLPETSGGFLPRQLSSRQLPSALCNALNEAKDSPFSGLIRRASQVGDLGRVVVDTAIIEMIKRSLKNPNGALASFTQIGDQEADLEGMLSILKDYWASVKEVFPDAWARDPKESRLMHSAGIVAMGDLMDRITARAPSMEGIRAFYIAELNRIVDDCAWTQGVWPRINRAWNEIESTNRDVKLLSQILVQIYAHRSTQ
jgi:DGQHR domain-containing protein